MQNKNLFQIMFVKLRYVLL